ncbi:MAG: ATP-binding cassette domain-containing protein, partial [Colwellia sp.]|nr:ATP-binding cassette domain-containing protein [Colwellia sp.]
KTIYENVVYGLRIMGENNRRRLDDAAEQSLRSAALWNEVKDRLHESALGLSGGQQQRVAVARALVINPKLILADEPTGNLDSKNGDEVMAMLRELNKAGTTVIMVTHSEKEGNYADRLVRLLDGQIMLDKANQVTQPAEVA